MADRIGLDLLNRARQPGGPGGAKLTWTKELQQVEKELLKADGDKPQGRLSRAAVDALLAVDLTEVANEATRRNLQRIQADAPRLLWQPQVPQAGVTSLRPGHAQTPVFINAAGWAVPAADIVGQPRDAKTVLAGAYNLAEALRRQVSISRSSLGSLLTMGNDVKAKMVENLISTANMARDVPLGGALPGLTPAETMELRSSAFTDLLCLASSMDRNTGGRIIDRVHNFLVELAEREPHRWLGEHMVKMLNHPMYQGKLTDVQKADALEAWQSKHRAKFEVKHMTDADGYDADHIVELRCTYDEATRHGVKPEGRPKPKGIIHWVSARHAIDATVRLYDRLFTVETPDTDAGEEGDFTQFLNPNSLEVLRNAKLEPSLKDAAPGSHWQFERVAYFYADPVDSKPGSPIFNRTVTLKDGWAPTKK